MQTTIRVMKWVGLAVLAMTLLLIAYVVRTWDRVRFPDRETFVARFQKGGRKFDGSPMPWNCFSHMTADDIGALYEFLHSLPPAGSRSPEDPTVAHVS